MTFAEMVAAVEAAAKAVVALTGLVSSQHDRIVELEAQVAAHDLQLKSAPPPGPKGN